MYVRQEFAWSEIGVFVGNVSEMGRLLRPSRGCSFRLVPGGGVRLLPTPQALLPAYLWGQALDPSQALLAFLPCLPLPPVCIPSTQRCGLRPPCGAPALLGLPEAVRWAGNLEGDQVQLQTLH